MSEPLSDERLAEIKARLEKATPRPWGTDGRNIRHEPPYGWMWEDHAHAKEEADAELIAHAPADIADLLAEVEKVEAISFSLAANQCHGGYGDVSGNHRCKYQDEIEKLKAEVERLKADGWISVRERLPEKEDRYLVLVRNFRSFSVPHDVIAIQMFVEGKFEYEPRHVKVTYWRPLPAPPESAR